jgi:hypothetical protein
VLYEKVDPMLALLDELAARRPTPRGQRGSSLIQVDMSFF